MQRIGRLKEKYSRTAQHYHIDVRKDPDGDNAIAIQQTGSVGNYSAR